jgi:hypothetical protein
MIGVDWVPGFENAVAVGERCEVKRDLSPQRRNDGVWWTVSIKLNGNDKVVAYARGVTITGVTPHVIAGTQRRWAGKRKKPCAWLVGELAVDAADFSESSGRVVTFDFHSGRPEFFFADNGETFATAPVVVFTDSGAYAAGME